MSGKHRRRISRIVLLWLAACQAPAPHSELAEADIPAGRTLARDGFASGGETIVVVSGAGSACRAPQIWGRRGADWRETSSGPSLSATACPSVSAIVAADGATIAVYDYSAGTAQLLDMDSGGFTAAGTARIAGEAGFSFPPPGPNVALSADGSRLLLGSVNRGCRAWPDGQRFCGSAELFERRDGTWERVATLVPPEDHDGFTRFGQSVAITPDSVLALAGGTGEPGFPGTLWVYALGRGEPLIVQQLTIAKPQGGFANDLSLAADGSWLAVGGDQSVHLFERVGGAFTLRKTLTPPDPDAGYFGATVALSADGSRLMVGAPRARCAEGDRCGVSYLFARDRFWSLARTIRPATNTPDANFGHHVAISRDGRYIAAQGEVIHVFSPGGAP